MPDGTGHWPALWMLPQGFIEGNKSWPNDGEIDLMEARGRIPQAIGSAIHFANETDSHQYISHEISVPMSVNFQDKFHSITFKWTENYIDMYLDTNSVPFFSEGKNSTPFNNAKVLINTSSEELFYKSQHIFINSDFETENLPVDEYFPVSSFFPAQSIGRVDLRSLANRNFTKLSIRNLDLEISPYLSLEDINSEIYIFDLQKAYGFISAYGFNQNINAFLEVKDLSLIHI